MLCWLCFLFTNGAQNRYKGNVDESDVFPADTELKLSECLKIGCTFDIANGPTKFDDADIGRRFTTVCRSLCYINNPILYCVSDVRDDLNGLS